VRVERARSELSLTLSRQPTVTEIAADVGADEEAVVEALEAFSAYRATSLDAPRGKNDGDPTLGDTLGTDERGFTRAEQRTMLKQLMRVLTPRERIVLNLRFAHDLTQLEIGERIGISQMQVSRILRQARARLRGYRLHSTTREIADRPRSRSYARR
jgi:RNA polymerase sigma-B factor